MFRNSVVSEKELTEFRQRTQEMIENGEMAKSRLKDAVLQFQQVPDIATVWSSEGLIRVEKGKARTRNPHYMTFVVNERGLKMLEAIYAAWQTIPEGERITVTLGRPQHQHRKESTYPAWTFKLNRRPDEEVVSHACAFWEMVARSLATGGDF